MVLYPLILSILSVLWAYGSTRIFWGHNAALIAASIWALLPIDCFYATILVPDLPAAFFASLATVTILFFLYHETKFTHLRFWGGVFAGLAVGASWLCKTTVSFFFPFFIILIFLTLRRNFKLNSILWLGFIIGSMGILLAETGMYLWKTGDWFYRLHEIERNYQENKNAFFVGGGLHAPSSGILYLKALLKRLFLIGPRVIFLNSNFILTPLLGLLSICYALYWRRREFFYPALWLLSLVFMFNFSSTSLFSYKPLVLMERYLYSILLPATILTAGFLYSLLFLNKNSQSKFVSKERLFWGALILALLTSSVGYSHYHLTRLHPQWNSDVHHVSKLINSSESIYTDILSIKGLEFFWQYPQRMNLTNFENLSPSSRLPVDSFVFINRTYLEWLTKRAGWWPTSSSVYKKPSFCDEVPSSWETVWDNKNASLYRVR
jgi:4-amino-4-deoxy-L-arabinose transferase-like glycosyltransferase